METFNSVKWAVSEVLFKEERAAVLFESLLDKPQPTWLLVPAGLMKKKQKTKKIKGSFGFILRGFFLGVHQTSMQQMLFIKGN